MMEEIKLYFKNDFIGTLSFNEDNYAFFVNKEYTNNAVLSLLNFSSKTKFVSPRLFYIFERFIPEKSRTDIINEAKILDTDSEFEILLKVASINLDKDQFWIGK